MFIIKVLAVYLIIMALSIARTSIYGLAFKEVTSTEMERHFELILAILFAAIIIREGLW